jgi:hypothetical protein
VPLSFADYPIGFEDYTSARLLQIGYDGDSVDFQELLQRYDESGRSFYEGLTGPPMDQPNPDLIGLAGPPVAYSDSGVWYFTPRTSGTFGAPRSLSIKGNWPQEQMVPKLLELGYKELEYQGVSYFALHEDYISELTHPLRNRSYAINRIAFMGDRLLSAPATDLLTPLIDVQQGNVATVRESVPHVALTRALGNGLLAGIFHPHADLNPPDGVDFPAEHLSGPNAWQSLSPYEVALRGYRLRDGVDEFVIALYYNDPMAAAPDALELEFRWSTITTEREVNYRTKSFSVSTVCSPFSTEVIEGDDFSILIASCPIMKEAEEDNPFGSPYLWFELPRWFLAQDPHALQQAFDNRPTPTPRPTPVPDVDKDQAIALALERISEATPPFTAVEDPKNPIAIRMSVEQAQELLSRPQTGSNLNHLVWVVQFQGDSQAEDAYNPDSPAQYHYAIEVLYATGGGHFDSVRTSGPVFKEGVEYGES